LLATAHGTQSDAFGVTEWMLLAFVALIWGSSFYLIEIALKAFQPGLISFGRVALGFLTLTLFPTARVRIERSDWPRIGLLGMTWVAIPMVLFPIAQQHIDSALTGMLNALVPIFAALFAAVLLRSLPRRVQAAGITVGFLGALAISSPAFGSDGSSAFGVALVALATVFYGFSINLAVPLQQRYGGPAVMLRALGVATVATIPFGIFGITDSEWAVAPFLALATLGIAGTGIAFVLMSAFVGHVGPTRGGVAVYFIPIVSIVLGVIMLNETVAAVQLAGTALVLAGAWLTSRRER
jgi:drug/metabolite transporter (DMT)-like permease